MASRRRRVWLARRSQPCAGTFYNGTRLGTVLSFGKGPRGRLGHGDEAGRLLPTVIEACHVMNASRGCNLGRKYPQLVHTGERPCFFVVSWMRLNTMLMKRAWTTTSMDHFISRA